MGGTRDVVSLAATIRFVLWRRRPWVGTPRLPRPLASACFLHPVRNPLPPFQTSFFSFPFSTTTPLTTASQPQTFITHVTGTIFLSSSRAPLLTLVWSPTSSIFLLEIALYNHRQLRAIVRETLSSSSSGSRNRITYPNILTAQVPSTIVTVVAQEQYHSCQSIA